MTFKAPKLYSLHQINSVLKYTGFKLVVGIPDDKLVDNFIRGDIKLGIKWFGFKDL